VSSLLLSRWFAIARNANPAVNLVITTADGRLPGIQRNGIREFLGISYTDTCGRERLLPKAALGAMLGQASLVKKQSGRLGTGPGDGLRA
jgi:hypothetical protein